VVDEVFQRLEHRREVRGGELLIELLGEALEINVGGVHLGVEVGARLGVDVAGGDGDALYAEGAAGIGGVHRVLGEDHRVVVGKRDGLGALADCGAGDLLGAGLGGERVHLLRLRDVPVLAELARQVAAGGAKRLSTEVPG
jgi:hypothetical protein